MEKCPGDKELIRAGILDSFAFNVAILCRQMVFSRKLQTVKSRGLLNKFNFPKIFDFVLAFSANADEMPQYAVFHLSLERVSSQP